MQVEIIPAILVKTRKELIDKIHQVKPYVNTIQIDVMDGNFVPNKTVQDFGDLPTGITYEFHWMVQKPQEYINKIRGSSIHLVHFETIGNFDSIEKVVRASGGKLGLAINPETPIESILPYLNRIYRVLVMTVNPGFSNQKYLSDMEPKIKKLRDINNKLDIEVDGGINKETIGRAVFAGANKLACASAIFGASDIKNAIEDLELTAKNFKEVVIG